MLNRAPLISAASGASERGSIPSVILWSLFLIALVMVGFFVVMRVRRWLREEDDAAGNAGFTLSDLRELHRRGQMSDEEFERAKSQMIAGAKALAGKLPDPLARGARPRRLSDR